MNTPDRFLLRAHRRTRLLPLLLALALALVSVALVIGDALGWWHPPLLVAPLVGLAALGVLIYWIRRARALTATSLARSLDAEWTLSGRLESAAELAGDSSAFAAAQRADTSARIAPRHEPGARAWDLALCLVSAILLLVFIQGGFLSFRLLTTGSITGPSPAAEPPAPPDISATLAWRSPKAEIKATTIEEVPLTAEAVTRTGLRSVALEIAVNGEHRLSRPLDAAALAPLAQAGTHPIELSLYLDEVGAQEFDIVSYYLRATRDTPEPAPDATSPLQFIQIRPAREDVTRVQASGGGSDLQKLALLIGNLKAAQVQLLKQNHLLAHDPIDHASPAWREENTRVAKDQALLVEKVAEAREFAISEAMPALVVDNLTQVRPLMESAAARIAESRNAEAASPQGKAIGLLASIEKILIKIIIEGGQAGGTPPPTNHDPFKDGQQFRLPPRPETPAGQLEQLAADQAEAAADPDADAREFLAKQAEIARRLAALDQSQALDPAAQQKAADAARDAAEAARQLELGDREAALAPAAAAAAALGEAVAAQEKAGLATAEATLEAARRELNAAERLNDPAARAAAQQEVAAKLRAEAAAQQQTGSAAAARALAEAAAKIDQAAAGAKSGAAPSPGGSPAPAPGQSPGEGKGQGEGQGQGDGKGSGSSGGHGGTTPATDAAEAATRAQAAISPRDQTIARAIRQLKGRATSGQATTGRGAGSLADQPGSPGGAAVEMELGAQLAAELLPPGDRELARELGAALRNETPTDFGFTPELQALVDKVLVRLEAARLAGRRDEQIRRFNPDDLDPAYRPAVETYFEKLSRESTKSPSEP